MILIGDVDVSATTTVMALAAERKNEDDASLVFDIEIGMNACLDASIMSDLWLNGTELYYSDTLKSVSCKGCHLHTLKDH